MSSDRYAIAPEVRLAYAKLALMFMDLGGMVYGEGEGGKRKAISGAEWFFFSKSSDMPLWCRVVDLDPEFVRREAQKVKETGIPHVCRGPRHQLRYGRKSA